MEKENTTTVNGSVHIPNGSSPRTPIIINGGTNNITIIETQHNDSSAVKTLESRDRVNEMTYKMVGSLMETLSKIGSDFIAKKREAKESPPVPSPSPAPAKTKRKPSPVSAKRKVVKTKSKKRK